MQQKPLVDDAIQVMDDQQRAGIKIYYAFREELERSHTFQRMAHDFTRHGSAKDINAASYDGEILMFAKSYGRVQLGMVGKSTPITMINQLQITWKPDTIRDLNPAPLFDMTRYVFEYKNPKPFRTRLARLRNLRNQTREMSVGTV